MKFKMEVRCNNAAFDDAPASELARIVREAATRIEHEGAFQGSCRDTNGNVVGYWRVTGATP